MDARGQIRTIVSAALLAAGVLAPSLAVEGAGRAIHDDVPKTIDPAARYLFHMHGRAVEVLGPNARTSEGTYFYRGVLEALADRGFVVISEVRSAGTELRPYATMVAGQVARLLAAGVPPEHVTVTGFSKGGAITVLTTALVGNPRVSFVVMAGCPPGGGRVSADFAAIGRPPQGRILSVYDENDTQGRSCASYFAGQPDLTFTETVLRVGLGHGLFYAPNKAWLDPVSEWALGRALR